MRMVLVRGVLVCAGLVLLATPSMAFWRHPQVVVNVGTGHAGGYGAYGAAPVNYGAAPCGTYGAAPCGSYGAAPSCSGSYGAGPSCSGSYGAGPGCSGSYGAGSRGTDKERELLKDHAQRLENRLDKIIASLQADKPSAGSGGAIVAGTGPADASRAGDLQAMTREWQNRRSTAVAAERERPAESSPSGEPRPRQTTVPGMGIAGR
jgi:hypothetical protein